METLSQQTAGQNVGTAKSAWIGLASQLTERTGGIQVKGNRLVLTVGNTNPDKTCAEYFVQYRISGDDGWYSDPEPDTQILLNAQRKAATWRRGDMFPKGTEKSEIVATRIIQRVTVVTTLYVS